MKRLGRLLLAVAALVLGGVLGSILLPDLKPLKIIIFFAACAGFGGLFYQIDLKKKKK